ncbi:MAG: hypothetical protein ABSC42_13920 [Tepidisphaeraceae bacterium]|jgi:hypothetical protein
MEMHPAHKYWATHINFVEGEPFFDFFKTLDSEIQEAVIGHAGATVGAPMSATYVQFKNACHDVVEAGMADFVLVHSLVAWVLAWYSGLSNPDDIETKEAWLRNAANWFKSQMVHADEARKKTLESVHAQAHESVQEMTSNTLKHQKIYLRICEELVAPLVVMNQRSR